MPRTTAPPIIAPSTHQLTRAPPGGVGVGVGVTPSVGPGVTVGATVGTTVGTPVGVGVT